jgi:hypothetical protein
MGYYLSNSFPENEWLNAIKKLNNKMARLRLSQEDEKIIKQIANKL